jgi:hypothetical protein
LNAAHAQAKQHAGLAMASKPSVDFCDYWQRHIKPILSA